MCHAVFKSSSVIDHVPLESPIMRSIVRVILFLFAILVAAIAGTGAYAYHWARTPIGALNGVTEVEIRVGSGVRSAAKQLRNGGIPIYEDAFVLLTRVLRENAVLKAGVYEIGPTESPLDILDKLIRGDAILSEIRFVEGWTFRQYRKAIEEHPDLLKESSGLAEGDLLAKIGATERHAEGLFYPDTYRFSKGTSDIAVLRRAYKSMQAHLSAVWGDRHPTSPLASPHDVLVMASIIEKETGRGEDRELIGAVFSNRLRMGMRLQADPTVIYGIGSHFDGNLRRRDLLHDTPYNTYTRTGLPPTPIAMPGLASLRAAVQPAQSDVLYFVAKGDGTSQFSKTLDEHNQAVARYQRSGG